MSPPSPSTTDRLPNTPLPTHIEDQNSPTPSQQLQDELEVSVLSALLSSASVTPASYSSPSDIQTPSATSSPAKTPECVHDYLEDSDVDPEVKAFTPGCIKEKLRNALMEYQNAPGTPASEDLNGEMRNVHQETSNEQARLEREISDDQVEILAQEYFKQLEVTEREELVEQTEGSSGGNPYSCTERLETPPAAADPSLTVEPGFEADSFGMPSSDVNIWDQNTQDLYFTQMDLDSYHQSNPPSIEQSFDYQYPNMVFENNIEELQAALLFLQHIAHSFNTRIIPPTEIQRRARATILNILRVLEDGLRGLVQISEVGNSHIEGGHLEQSIRENPYFVDHYSKGVVKKMVDALRDVERLHVADNCGEAMQERRWFMN
jgi:hypothetical protein